MKLRTWTIFASIFLCASFAHAHIGNPDIYAEGQAGPYKLFVVVRPPLVIPGVADVEVRSETPGVNGIAITPIPLTGEASKYPPVPEDMKRSTDDTAFFTGHLWIMATGSWQIRLTANGGAGNGVVSIPVPATATGTLQMTLGLRLLLAALGIFLFVSMIGIVGAAAGEAKLAPGAPVPQANHRYSYIAMSVCFALLVAAAVLGRAWWNAEALSYSQNVYKPLQMKATLYPGNVLDLKLHDPGWLSQRKLDDFIPDHDHLMHLYVIRWPAMDLVAHLHPDFTSSGEFRLVLPSLPAGDYRLYADVVHANGFPETLVSEIKLPAISGRPLAGDDAEGTSAPIAPTNQTQSLPENNAKQHPQGFKLPDGYSMVWLNAGAIEAKAPLDLQFALLDPQGKPAPDMALYMGMIGHAAFVKTDGAVFAHIHPTGTVSMAAYMMANPNTVMPGMAQGASSGKTSMSGMPGMTMTLTNLPNVVGFPYGFPSEGSYRIFVQMKHGQTVETGFFDTTVEPAAVQKAS